MTAFACSLSAAGNAQRARAWARLREDALVCTEREGLAVTACWRPDPGVRERLDALVAAERECCPFLSFADREHPRLLVTVLSVPPGAEPYLDLFGGANST
jgi:hypothetical protein